MRRHRRRFRRRFALSQKDLLPYLRAWVAVALDEDMPDDDDFYELRSDYDIGFDAGDTDPVELDDLQYPIKSKADFMNQLLTVTKN